MAKRGETTLTDSDGQTYVLKFGTNAICETQRQLNMSLGQILKSMTGEAMDMVHMRTMVKCALIHPKDITDEQIGDFIDDIGWPTVAEVIGKVFRETGGNGGPPGLPSGDATASNAPLSASTPTDSTH